MRLGARCPNCRSRQSLLAQITTSRWRHIVCSNCESHLTESTITAVLRTVATLFLVFYLYDHLKMARGWDVNLLAMLPIGLFLILVTEPLAKLVEVDE